MTPATPTGQPARFTIHFHDDHIAPAPAGSYRATLEHEVSGEGVGSDRLPPVIQEFEIRAPQFTLDASFVHAVHPAPAASGAFEYVLPHITLNRLILPWERTPDPDRPGMPWLALLLFAEEELPGDPRAQARTVTRTVRDLLQGGGPEVLVPDLAGVPGELMDSDCTTIDIPAAVYAALLPHRTDLGHLCHLRKVRDRQAARVRGPSGEILEVGDYAVVVANRFPRTAGRYAAHLVSLEGFANHLEGRPPAQPVVRMVSLIAWSFEATPNSRGHFAALIRDLAEDRAGLGLRLNPRPTPAHPPAASGPAAERLTLGYAPVEHILPSGERTFAWYRGPFTPVVPQPLPAPDPPAAPLDHADQALIYATDTGVFDVSYAAAFTLGRSLALSDATLAATLTTFRNHSRRIASRALLHHGRTEAWATGGAHPARDRFHALVEQGLGHRLHEASTAPAGIRSTSTPRRQSGGVPRPPSVTALTERLLDATRADGLRQALDTPLTPLISALDQVRLLAMTPLAHLVPDAGMLPPESLRFFHVDPAWCAALRDGVLATGAGTSLDSLINTLAHQTLDPPTPLSGLLMRSALVQGWPDVIVEPQRAQLHAPELLPIAHRRLIGPDLLLCLFEGVPDAVVFREPHEGIHFGVDEDDRIGLRRLTDPVGESLGDGAAFPPPDGEGMTRFLRALPGGANPEILNLVDGADPLLPALAAALRAAGELPENEDLSPGAFAVELINAPQRIAFTPDAPGQP